MNQQEIREQQRQLWNKFSSGWKKWDTFVLDWLRPIGDKLIEVVTLKEGDLVLDVATGTGEPGLTAATKIGSGKVTGTDLAEEMVAIANENAQKRGVTNYDAQVTDAHSLPFKDNTFDVGICRFGIMYFPDPVAGVRELARVVKPQGRIALSAWSGPDRNPWATLASSIINKRLEIPPPPTNTPSVFRHAQTGVLANVLQQADLKDIKTDEVIGTLTFDSPEHYWEFVNDVIAPVATALSKVDDAVRQELKQAVCEATKSYEKDGKIVLSWSSWVVSA